MVSNRPPSRLYCTTHSCYLQTRGTLLRNKFYNTMHIHVVYKVDNRNHLLEGYELDLPTRRPRSGPRPWAARRCFSRLESQTDLLAHHLDSWGPNTDCERLSIYVDFASIRVVYWQHYVSWCVGPAEVATLLHLTISHILTLPAQVVSST
ncbi:hypothetical protein J6590_026624 [Homalodisca vitripennis]|nr:hypothetical protein J6590_026624 [Homalodisca vitripennis]